ncbi:MAG: hypothetical protein RR632_07985, partial [Christensenella sp.]
ATSYVFTVKIDNTAPADPENAPENAPGNTPTNAQTQKTQGKKAQDPKILQPTADVSVPVVLGEVASLAITAANTVSYQWEIDRGDGFKPLSGADKAYYKTPPITAQENGYCYRCVATGAKGTTPATSPIFTLTLIEATTEAATEFKILSPTQDTSITLDEGETAALSVTATGATGYQWQRASGIAFKNIDGATDASYTTPPFTAEDNGSRYVCVVTGKDGATLTSPVFTLKQSEEAAAAAVNNNMPWIIGLCGAGAAAIAAAAAWIIRKRRAVK